MTNAESYLQTAIEALENGNLDSKSAEFVKSIKDYSKKQLKGLSSKQFDWLRNIARAN
jgi:hypothetical protein